MAKQCNVDPPSEKDPGTRVVAVIELGTTSIRMLIAQIDATGVCRTLESLQQAVTLGKDTFTRGAIAIETTEDCVRVLRDFRRLLDEYQIRDERDITAVATSAVREASNQEAFLDRLFIATGISVKAIDEAEVNRYTFSALYPYMRAEPLSQGADALAVEVGGGSTEVLLLHRGRVANSHSYRLGSLRLRNMLEQYRASAERLAVIMGSHVERSVVQIRASVSRARSLTMLCLGGDARFACSLLVPDRDTSRLTRLEVSGLSRLTDEVLKLSVDDIVRRYHIPYPDAETLSPALLIYLKLAQSLGLKEVFVGQRSLRDGVLAEMAIRGAWTQQYRQQIVNSAIGLGKKYHFDQRHAEHVAALAGELFAALQNEHRLAPRYGLILTVAALLHEVGLYVSNRSHHKHSMYLIQNSDLFGLGTADLLLTALVARYHRRAHPKPNHEGYATLSREDRMSVAKMAAILRVADSLDGGRVQRRRRLNIKLDPGRMSILMDKAGDLTLEQHGIQEKGGLFEEVYGMKVVLKSGKGGAADGGGQSQVH